MRKATNPPRSMSSYVIYARKSTESEDRQVASIDAQIHELRVLGLRRGLTNPEILQEAHSAKAPGRPVFGQLMRRILKGEIDGVLCWKMDRLARNHLDHGRVLQALADGKLRSVITPERTYTGDGNDRFIGNFELGIATKYIDDLRTNVKRGNRERFRRGWPNHRPPMGYLEDQAKRTIIKDPDRFELVRRMWDMLLSRAMRPSQILKVANTDWGLRTRKTARQGGNPIQHQHLYKIFGNIFYTGLFPIRGELHKGGYPPMVTMQEFEEAQRILGRPGRPRPSKNEFAYAGMLFCRRCKSVLIPERHVKPSGKAYTYYRCRARLHKAACRTRTLPEADFEEQILKELRRLAITPEAAKWIADNLGATLSKDVEQRKGIRESLDQALAASIRESDTLITMRQREQINDEQFETRNSEVSQRQAKLRLRLEQPEARPDELLGRLQEMLEFSTSAPAVFEASVDPVRRRQIVASIFANSSVDDRRVLTLAKEPFSFLAQARDPQRWWTMVEDVRTWLLTPGALDSLKYTMTSRVCHESR